MDLVIASATSHQEQAVSWVSFDTTEGNFTVLNGHAPAVWVLKPRSALVLGFADERQETVLVPGGVVEVTRTGVQVLVA